MKKIIRHNKLFDDKVLKFLFSEEKDSKTFVHYTKDESTARKISKEGFMFVNPFEKTAEQVFNDPIDLTYKHNIRKYYGKYIVVICISNDIYKYHDNELKPLNEFDNKANQVLLNIPSFLNDNQDEVFTLSKSFVKGYFNYETGAIVINPEFKLNFSTFCNQA